MRTTSLLIALVLIAGCAAPSESIQKQKDRVGHGAPVTGDYRRAIMGFIEMATRDAESSRIKIGTPIPKYIVNGVDFQHVQQGGYFVPVMLNGKNAYGGYTGYEQWGFFIRNNRIVAFSAPEENESGMASDWIFIKP